MTVRPFGTMPDGRMVQVATLRAGELTAPVLTLGATLRDLRLAGTPYPGLMGQPYGPHAGLAREPQFWPNAPHHPDFPQITLTPGMPWRQTTRYHIARIEDLPATPPRPPS